MAKQRGFPGLKGGRKAKKLVNTVIINEGGSGGDVTTADLALKANKADAALTGDAELIGTLDIVHVAIEEDDHAFEIDCDADGFGDVKAVDIFYDSGAIIPGDDEGVILVNLDKSASTGGDISALEVLATEGTADANAVFAGATVNPIEQLSGVFADMDSALVNAVDQLTAFTTAGTDVQMFVLDNDTVTIGDAAKFEEIEFLLAIVASGGGIAPTFEYSTGVGTWASFTPVDGTNGMRNNGVIAWLDGDIPTWAVGTGTEYLIRITRTRNSLGTTPTESLVQISATTEYKWDKDGDLTVNSIAGDGAGLTGLAGKTETLTNKRITKRISTEASNTAPSIDADAVDSHLITALAGNISTAIVFTGTPTNQQFLLVSITDNGTARTLSWDATDFEASTVALPTTTVISERLDIGFVYNSATSKFRCIAVS